MKTNPAAATTPLPDRHSRRSRGTHVPAPAGPASVGRKPVQEPAEPAGLYVHVPFCSGKCSYCDFYSITDLDLVEDWLNAVLQEARLPGPAFHRFDTLYLGGGTPSILDEGSLSHLLEGLRSQFRFAEDVEITLEANPEDVRPASLAAFRRLGVNRISLGIQSLDPETLAVFGRRHTADRAKLGTGSRFWTEVFKAFPQT